MAPEQTCPMEIPACVSPTLDKPPNKRPGNLTSGPAEIDNSGTLDVLRKRFRLFAARNSALFYQPALEPTSCRSLTKTSQIRKWGHHFRLPRANGEGGLAEPA
ncbi:type iii restriction res subunit [Lasius niger]|uniref:Type iii restriction res subunit n=1 Tax=Lasius niger TaxID=67767 RepID=A0A0J7K6P8_LASNI|nr:type iii restriction res subunit [Lasius niger]